MKIFQKILIVTNGLLGFDFISKFKVLRFLYWKAYLFYKKTYEAKDFVQIVENLTETNSKEIRCILDIGAHIGSSSHFLRRGLPNAVIHAFEPDHRNCFLFREFHGSDIKTGSIRLNNLAVWKQSGLIPFKFQLNNSADNKFDIFSSHRISSITIDEYVQSNSVTVNLIKIDVQGYELEVLLGARATLREQMPLLIVEVDKSALSQRNKTYHLMIDHLKFMGYQGFNSKLNLKISPQELDDMMSATSCKDILFVPSS